MVADSLTPFRSCDRSFLPALSEFPSATKGVLSFKFKCRGICGIRAVFAYLSSLSFFSPRSVLSLSLTDMLRFPKADLWHFRETRKRKGSLDENRSLSGLLFLALFRGPVPKMLHVSWPHCTMKSRCQRRHQSKGKRWAGLSALV